MADTSSGSKALVMCGYLTTLSWLTLIWPNNDKSTLCRVNAEMFVCMAVSIIVTLVVVINLV